MTVSAKVVAGDSDVKNSQASVYKRAGFRGLSASRSEARERERAPDTPVRCLAPHPDRLLPVMMSTVPQSPPLARVDHNIALQRPAYHPGLPSLVFGTPHSQYDRMKRPLT